MNKSDSEKIAALLEKKGYQSAKNEQEADLIVLNICSVRQSAIDRVYNKIRGFNPALRSRIPLVNARVSKKIILTGCILEEDKKRFAQAMKTSFSSSRFADARVYGEIIKFKELFKIKQKPRYEEGFIPIMEGCNNFCAYCVVPYTRGREYYREKKEIINEVKNLIKKGFKKITLLGQNVNSYPDFPQLLEEIANLPGDFELTFLTSHPKDFSDELIDIMAKNEKIVRYLNLPVQSGDDEILKKMNRPYTVKQYKNLVKKIRKKISDIKLSTDVIVGFPGETKKQFKNTVKLFKEIKFHNAYISKYSPRPGTTAYKLKDNVLLEEKKRRYKILNNLLKKKKGL
jgi:tRNA-2-methylthio-N6-dimethylallyladenosine synthase